MFLTPAQHRTESAYEAPAVDTVPRWAVLRYPSVGSDAIQLVGHDGEGYPLVEVRCKVGGNLALWEKVIERELEVARAKAESRPPLLAPRVLLTLLP